MTIAEQNNSPELQEKLNMLRKIYLQQLPTRREEILRVWDDIPRLENPQSAIETLRNLVHRLSGSAGTYGFPDLSHIAKTLEYSLEEVPTNFGSSSLEELHTIHQGLTELDEVISHYLEASKIKPHENEDTLKESQGKPKKKLHTPQILFYETSQYLIEDAPVIFESYGYKLHINQDIAEIADQVKTDRYDALIIDIQSSDEENSVFAEVKKISEKYPMLPIFFLSKDSDLKTRLKVVRSGGKAFFEKPYDIGDIIEKLDKFIIKELDQPYRILIVDDDYHQAAFHEAILQDEGMITHIITDPMNISKPLVEFQPDVVLMDLYMPECTGLELASVIRQQDSFLGLPIVFLSSEKRKEKQSAAMKLGGDEFLTKPVKKEDLISAICIRAERMRTLRSFMAQDSLTGLLNHSSTQASLDILLAQAKRNKGDLSFVLIDLDHFKQVNDNYGHLSGDHVLKRLARYLKQRLRHGDIIGRYGGEEFAIILPNTSVSAAFEVMDSIREGFAEIKHPVQGKNAKDEDFIVTLSIGIASFPDYDEPTLLTQMADKALYAAKAGGRNCVIPLD